MHFFNKLHSQFCKKKQNPNNRWRKDKKNTKYENKELKNKMEEKTIPNCSQLERSNKTFPLPVLQDNLTN